MRGAPYRYVGSSVLIYYRFSQAPYPRLGMTISKKYGKAFARARLKRCIREAFRYLQHDLPAGLEMNVLPAKGCASPSFEKIVKDFQEAFRATQ